MTRREPAAGSAAPDFSARNQHSEPVELSSLGAPALLMFYPFAFSRVCGSELAEIAARWDEVRATGAAVLAISCDAVHTLRAFAEELGAPPGLQLVSDFWPHGAISESYGAFSQAKGAPSRTSFLLGSGLTIQHIIEAAPAESRDLDETLRLLRTL
ncbi:redoxin domain-containing protein [Nesterenkonia populi]|uniref:redoxin domain-containing protein n=1 Tax=Nesterenkonia populi TaxID=1591087 RepID=UPI0011BD9AE7|nr:redoxin domain-containing protein [Nesterenkonia populi]